MTGTAVTGASARARRGPPAPRTFVLAGQSRFAASAAGAEIERATVGSFPNGELHIDLRARVDGRRCVVVGSIAPPPGNLERVTLLAHTLRRTGATHVTAVLPYLAYARQDEATPTESLGLQWAGGLLRASGVDAVVCVDVHSAVASEVLGLPVTSLSPAGLLADALPAAWREDVVFVAPDEGAIERCRAVATAAGSADEVVWLRKRRTKLGVEHAGVTGPPGRRAVIVDDILDTGGTLLSCCRELRRAGTEEIAVVATHGLFTGSDWRALFAAGVRRMWITDTVLARRRPAETEVVGVAPLLAPALGAATIDREEHHAPSHHPPLRRPARGRS